MKNPFKKTELPCVTDLFNALLNANKYLHPEWDDAETIFNSAQIARGCKTHKHFAIAVNGVCKSALDKMQEVAIISEQFQLTTEINN